MAVKATLTDAKEALAAMLDEIDLLPDAILEACNRLGKPSKLVRIPHWSEHDAGADLYTESELFDLVFERRSLPTGNALVVTDESFISGLVLNVGSEELRQMVGRHHQLVFDADIVFLWPESECLSVFHHEGAYAHIGW
jgi:hypothetical protein